MERNLCSLDLNTLKALYEQEAAQLQDALLKGVSWEGAKNQRQAVTELAIAIHKKRFDQNPAESDTRSDRKNSGR